MYLTAEELKTVIGLCNGFILNPTNHEREKVVKEKIMKKCRNVIKKRKDNKANNIVSKADAFNANEEETNLIGYKIVATKVEN